MNEQVRSEGDPSALIDRLAQAVNDHDLEALVACFDDGYVNETPVHPRRGFQGNEQVRRNWSQIFASVPDIRVRLPRTAADGDTVWTEWEMSGTRHDGAAFRMAGVVIFRVVEGAVASARFYLEPVEETSGDVNAEVTRVTGGAAAPGNAPAVSS